MMQRQCINKHAGSRDLLGIQNTKLCEDAHVSSLQADAALHESNELIIVTTLLVELADLYSQIE